MDMKQLKKFVKGAEEAVSPVVATLMLVLVAAGAAVGFSVFMGAFQDEAQGNLNSDIKGNCLTIGGSTTVHPINARMQELYQLAQPNLCVELSQGGSGAGLIGVGTGLLDIGGRSAGLDADDFARYPDLDQDGKKDSGAPELKTHILGYDAVTWFHASSCLAADEIAELNYEAVQDLYANALQVTLTRASVLGVPTGNALPGGTGDYYTWNDLSTYLDSLTAANDGASCLSPGPGADDIILTDRADLGGTSELACEKLIGTKAGDSEAGTVAATLNSDAKKICSSSSNKQIPDSPNILSADGNAAVEALFTSDNVFGYSSFGTGEASGLDAFAFEGVVPSVATIVDESFAGSRPVLYVTVGEPQGDVKAWIDFVRDPQRNDEVLGEIGYISYVDALS